MFGYESEGVRAGPSQAQSMNKERQESVRRFAQLKPICLKVLASIPSERSKNVKSVQDVAALELGSLEESLKAMIAAAAKPLDLSLITYVFYPISKMMRDWTDPPDRVRARQYSVLACLLQDWWPEWAIVKGGKEDAVKRWDVWNELLLLCAIALTRSSERANYSNETIVAILQALHNLLSPRLAIRAPSHARRDMSHWEWDGEEELPDLNDYEREMGKLTLEDANQIQQAALVYPTDAHLEHIYDSKKCRSVLAHALTASIDVSRRTDRPRHIRSSSLRIVRTILQTWFSGSVADTQDSNSLVQSDLLVQQRSGEQWCVKQQAERVSLYLPGVTSTIVRIAKTPKESSEVFAEAVSLLRMLLTTCCNDEVMATLVSRNLRASQDPVTLEELFTRRESVDLDGAAADHQSLKEDAREDTDDHLDQNAHLATEAIRGGGEELVRNIAIALEAIHALRFSESHSVQTALAELAGVLLLRCWSLCNGAANRALTRRIFGWLVLIACSQASSEKATNTATALVVRVMRAHTNLLREDLSAILQSWPHLLASAKEEEELADAATRLTLLLRLASGGVDGAFSDPDTLQFLFMPLDYERWTFMLVTSIQIDFTAAVQTSLRLRNVSLRVNDAVMRAFRELGCAASRIIKIARAGQTPIDSPLGVIEHLVRLSGRLRPRDVHLSLNAAVLANMMLSGTAEQFRDIGSQVGLDNAKVRKRLKKALRSIIAAIVDIWQNEEVELLSEANVTGSTRGLTEDEKRLVTAHTDAADSVISEFSRGLSSKPSKVETEIKLGPSVQVDFVNAAKVDALQQRSKAGEVKNLRNEVWSRSKCDATLLQLIAHAAKILGQSVRPLLMNTIYPMISALASSNEILQESAASAVHDIAYSAGYASTQGLLLDHADYILGAACHRLVSTLSLEIEYRSRLVASHETPLQIPMTSAISAPLVLIEMIRSLGTEVVALVEDAIDEVLDAIDRFHTNEEVCDNLLTVLERVVEAMLEQEIAQPTTDKTDAPAIGFVADNDRDFDSFAAWYEKRRDDETEKANTDVEHTEDTDAEADKSATRTQVVTDAMLKKALPFLSHESRTIRLRCLRLLNRGVEFLCRQGLKVEPLSIVNDGWPIFMRRCGFSLDRKLPSNFDKAKAEDLDEKDFFVAVEAVKLVATVARYLVEYVGGRKMFEEAVPRIMMLLAIVESAETQDAGQRHAKQNTTFLLTGEYDASVPANEILKSSRSFRPIRPYSPLAVLCEQVLLTLDTVVASMGPAITEANLFAFASHPTLLTCLDCRQLETIRDQARHFYFRTLMHRNAPLVWFTIQAVAATPGFPRFLARPELSLSSM